MTKRFRMILSVLCALALLVNVTAVFAEDEPQGETPDVEVTDVEVPAEIAAAQDSGEEQPAQASGEGTQEPEETTPADQTDPAPAESVPAETPAETVPETPADATEGNDNGQGSGNEVVSESVVLDVDTTPETPAESAPEGKDPAPQTPGEDNEPESVPDTDEPSAGEAQPEPEEEKTVREFWVGSETLKEKLKAGKPFEIRIMPDVTGKVLVTVTLNTTFGEDEEIKFFMNDEETEFILDEENSNADISVYTKKLYAVYGQTYLLAVLSGKDAELTLTAVNEPKEEETAEEELPAETPENVENTVTEEENAPETDSGLNETELPADRTAVISISWDDDNPGYGSVAHFNAELIGYGGLEYTIQWQWSRDGIEWFDVEGAISETMDIEYTAENGSYQWRIVVDVI